MSDFFIGTSRNNPFLKVFYESKCRMSICFGILRAPQHKRGIFVQGAFYLSKACGCKAEGCSGLFGFRVLIVRKNLGRWGSPLFVF